MFLKPRPILISLLITALFVAGLFATPALATVYVPSATVSSVNLLAGTSASVLTDFYYNLSALPATASVKVQFSKDNTNWYSSTGSAGAWDTISTLGGATLPLSGFVSAASWSAGNAFYYKMQLNSTSDQSQTPTVSGIRLDYTASSGYENKFVFSSAGFVGIGTTNPATLLHLAGFNPAVSITSTNLTQTMSLGIDSGGNNYIWPKTGAFGVYNNAGNAFNLFLNSGGSLGVGTSNPQYLLDVAGSGNFANPVFVGTPTADGHAATKSYVDSAIATATGTINTNALWTLNGSNLYASSTSWNVGIGTTNPTKKLAVAGNLNFVPVTEPNDSAMTAALAGTGAGNVDNGKHYYQVVYQTAEGQTGTYAYSSINATVSDKTTNGKVLLSNIPISSDPRVTARRIYRTAAGSAAYAAYYLATINDNTTTTYTDNTADSGLSTTDGMYRKANTTAGLFYNNGTLMAQASDIFHTAFGVGALSNNVYGNSIVAVGGSALTVNTTGSSDVAVGYSALSSQTDANDNVGIGYAALLNNVHGNQNVGIGSNAIRSSSGDQTGNTGVGHNVLQNGVQSNNYNSGFGWQSGMGFQGSHNIFVGYNAGYLSTAASVGDYNLFIGDSAGQNAAAGAGNNILIGKGLSLPTANGTNQLVIGNSIALISGKMDPSPINQTVTINASLGLGTTNPQYTLDASGTGNFTNPVFVGTPTAAGHAATKSYVDSAIATATGTIGTSLLWSGTAGGNIWNANGANNVGIGTTNPGFNLEINGSFKAAASSSSIILDTNGNISIGI